MSDLFRTEVIEARRRRNHGEVTLWQPVSWAAYISFGLVCAASIALFLNLIRVSTTERLYSTVQTEGALCTDRLFFERAISLQAQAPRITRVTVGQEVFMQRSDGAATPAIISGTVRQSRVIELSPYSRVLELDVDVAAKAVGTSRHFCKWRRGDQIQVDLVTTRRSLLSKMVSPKG